MHKKYLFPIAIMAAIVFATGCKPDYPSCKKDAHCHEGEYCVNNLCQQCMDDGDCPEGQACNAGGCREIPGYCQDSTDCSDGQVCRENTCGPCMSAGDCDNGKVCISGSCKEAECHSTAECPAGLSCIDYQCQVDKNATSGIGDGDCKITPLYFEFDSHEIDQTMRATIEKNYDCLLKRGGKVVLEGHCDASGTTEYNMALGERRARIVRKVMATLGFDKSKMKVISKGEEEATGKGEAGRAKDRRVDFK